MGDQPTGLVAMLFSDIEGSTKLLDRLGPDTYAESLDLHRKVLREAACRHDAYEVAYEGDSFFFAFADASAALAAADEAQSGLAAADWPEDLPFRVRMGIHAGEVLAVPPKYVGLEVHRAARIMAAAHGGQVVVSAAALKLAEADGLDLGEHRLKDLLQPIRLYQLRVGSTTDRFPPLRSLGDLPTNLPVQPNGLIGRRRELEEISTLLTGDDVRLVTLVGVGGAGKTRLAVQAAAEASDGFPSGVFVVFLASLRDPELVPGAIAEALGVRPVAGETLEESLVEYLRERELLLVLDNFEQVGAAATVVAKLLEECPGLRVLTTSRTRLRIRAEHLYDVPPLDDDDALDLLLARIAAGRRGRDTDMGGVDELRQISRALDGLPLALELAAPLLSIYEPDELLARMDRRLELLADGPLDLSERQRTLRAAIEWSYELLSPEARELLAQSSVFAGGANLEALEAVCGRDIQALTALVDGSLARVDRGRMLLLETIREYAAERLEQSGHVQETRERHAGYFLALAEESREPLRGPDQALWLDRLEAERPNARAALEHYIAPGDVERAIRLAAAYGNFWYRRSLYAEGRYWLAATLALGGEPSPARVRASNSLGNCCIEQGDLDAAQMAYEAALGDARDVGDDELRATCLNNLGTLAWDRGDWSAATERFTDAMELVDESSADAAMFLANLGTLALSQGEAGLARSRLEQSLALRRALADDGGIAQSLFQLGLVLVELRDFEGARGCFVECLDLAERLGDTQGFAVLADALALLAGAGGDARRTARLVGLANALREEIGGSLSAAMTTRRERWIDPVRDADPDAFERGVAEGVALAHDVPALLAELRQTS